MKLFKKKEKPVKNNSIDTLLLGEDEITAIKPTKGSEPQNFLNGFDMEKHKVVDNKILDKIQNPPTITIPRQTYEPRPVKKLPVVDTTIEQKKEILKNSILIMLKIKEDRKDLDFIGESRINGRPIYRYIGKDFSTFDLEYEEVFYNPGFGIF